MGANNGSAVKTRWWTEMDKQPNKISIKINGKEAEYKEQAKSTVKKQEKVEAHSSSEEEFSWILPEEQPSKVVSIEDLRQVKSKKKTFLKKKSIGMNRHEPSKNAVKHVAIIMSVAILVGTGLGMFSLNMMTGENSAFTPKKTDPVAVNEPPVALEEKTGEGQRVEEKNPSSLPSFSAYAVQAGVFSTKKTGEEAVRKMRAKGYAAAVIKNGDSYALFIGVGLGEKDTKGIGEHYKKQGEDTYVKSYEIPAIQTNEWSKNELEVMTKGQSIFETLLSLSSKTAAGSSSSSTELKGIKEELVKLKSEQKLNQDIGKFLSYLLMAEAALADYEKDQKDEVKWQAQQFLLQALSVYSQMK
jgi:stage II sporulation protein B